MTMDSEHWENMYGIQYVLARVFFSLAVLHRQVRVSPLARVHSATILTDYDGAVLLMLLHDGDDD